jgi:hypothetical protein
MSDDLSGLIRAAALEQEAAAGHELPYSDAVLGRYVRDIRRRRVADGAMLAVVGVVVIGGVVLGASGLDHAGVVGPIGPPPVPAVTPTPTPTTTPAPTPTPSVAPTPTLATTAPAAPPTSAPPRTASPPTSSATTAAPSVERPGAVTVVYSGPGGGSGEVMVTWTPMPGATGYRVYRSDAAAGPFSLSASYDVASGRTTVAFGGTYETIVIWQPTSGDYRDVQYIEAILGSRTYFQVTAFNAAGEGPRSGVVCSEAPGLPPTQC